MTALDYSGPKHFGDRSYDSKRASDLQQGHKYRGPASESRYGNLTQLTRLALGSTQENST